MEAYPYAWVKRGGDPSFTRDTFSPVSLEGHRAVGFLAEFLASKFKGWGVESYQVGLYLVAPGGDLAPTSEKIDAVLGDEGKRLGEGLTLAAAGVAPGSWLVARVPPPHSVGEGALQSGEGAVSNAAGQSSGMLSAVKDGSNVVAASIVLPGDLSLAVGGGGSSSTVVEGRWSAASLMQQLGFLPLNLSQCDVGGVAMYVAKLEQEVQGRPPIPFFLSTTAYHTLEQFVQVPETAHPQLLLVSGTIKSGKSTLVRKIIPGMVLSAAGSAAQRPVFLHVSLGVKFPALDAAARVVKSAWSLARALGINLPDSLAYNLVAPLLMMADVVRALSVELLRKHCILWLLLDELGAPFTASIPPDMRSFADQLKTILETCATSARIVATGSGMMTLLGVFRTAPVNSFSLFDAIVHVPLGQEPPPPVALAMAEQLLAAHSSSWIRSPDLVAAITPQVILDSLRRELHGHTTSQRPGLMALLLDTMAACQGTPKERLHGAVASMLDKLRVESEEDAATALAALPHSALLSLRGLADLGSTAVLEDLPSLFERKLGIVVRLFFEDTSPAQLLPPYGALLRAWVTPQGTLSITRSLVDGKVALLEHITRSLSLILDYRRNLTPEVGVRVSQSVLRTLAQYSVGTLDPLSGTVRPPNSVAELGAIPAVKHLMMALDSQWARMEGKAGKLSPSHAALQRALLLEGPGAAQFMSQAGYDVLAWMRHHAAHVWFPFDDVVKAGLTSSAREAAVRAAMEAVLLPPQQEFTLDSDGGLTLHASIS